VILENQHPNTPGRRDDRRELGEDIDAVRVFLDHALDTPDLTLKPAQSCLNPALVLSIRRLVVMLVMVGTIGCFGLLNVLDHSFLSTK
jgi:hypothetical protein